jgi:hypothetical protein
MGVLYDFGCVDSLVGVPCFERAIFVVQNVLPEPVPQSHTVIIIITICEEDRENEENLINISNLPTQTHYSLQHRYGLARNK